MQGVGACRPPAPEWAQPQPPRSSWNTIRLGPGSGKQGLLAQALRWGKEGKPVLIDLGGDLTGSPELIAVLARLLEIPDSAVKVVNGGLFFGFGCIKIRGRCWVHGVSLGFQHMVMPGEEITRMQKEPVFKVPKSGYLELLCCQLKQQPAEPFGFPTQPTTAVMVEAGGSVWARGCAIKCMGPWLQCSSSKAQACMVCIEDCIMKCPVTADMQLTLPSVGVLVGGLLLAYLSSQCLSWPACRTDHPSSSTPQAQNA